MILDKTIKFGYGSILVGYKNGFVTLEHIKPPKEIGKSLLSQDVTDIVTINKVKFQCDLDMFSLIKKLDGINEQSLKLEFRGYVFDFTKYNPKSLEAVRSGFKHALSEYQMVLAC
jgi:hypothetical protein